MNETINNQIQNNGNEQLPGREELQQSLRAKKLQATLVKQLRVMDIAIDAAREQEILKEIYDGLGLERYVRNLDPHRPQESNPGESENELFWDPVELDLREFEDDAFYVNTEFFTEFHLVTMLVPDELLCCIESRRDADTFRVFGVIVELDLETDAMIVQVKRSSRIPFGGLDKDIMVLEFDGQLEGRRLILAGLGINFYCENGYRIQDLQRFSFYTSCMEDIVTEDIVQ